MTVGVLVTDAGVAVHPARPDVADRLRRAGLPLRPIEALQAEAARLALPRPPGTGTSDDERIVAVVEYRDRTVIDVVRAMPPASR